MVRKLIRKSQFVTSRLLVRWIIFLEKSSSEESLRIVSFFNINFLLSRSFLGSVEDVKQYFSQFGHVEDAILKMDYPKQQHRGFGFMTFVHAETADLVCNIRYHILKGKNVECKMAQKKEFVKPNGEAAAAASTFLSSLPQEQVAAIFGVLFKSIVPNGNSPIPQQIQLQQQIHQQLTQNQQMAPPLSPKIPSPIAPPPTSIHHPANQLNALENDGFMIDSAYRRHLAMKYANLNQMNPSNWED